jgi:hypothetical protein
MQTFHGNQAAPTGDTRAIFQNQPSGILERVPAFGGIDAKKAPELG